MYLRLYDRSSRRRLTKSEVDEAKAEAAIRQMQAEAERAKREALRAQALAEKLRALGIDPDQPL